MKSKLLIEIDPDTNEAIGSISCSDIKWAEKTLGGKWIQYDPDKHILHAHSGTVYWSDEFQNFSRQRPDPWSVFNKEKHDWVLPSARLDREASKLLLSFNIYDPVFDFHIEDQTNINLMLANPCNHFVLRWGESKEKHTFLFISRNLFCSVDYNEEREPGFQSIAVTHKDLLVPSQTQLRLEITESAIVLRKWNEMFLREEVAAHLPGVSFDEGTWYDAFTVDCIGGIR